MGHGKETPRQKMIGMMYLVLTALLALNVAAEVLNAFVLIDDSLRKTTENAVKKNNKVYTDFEAAYNEKKAAVKPFKDKADKISKKTKELIDYVDSLKIKIVRTADGPEGDPTKISSKDDLNIPGQILLTEKVDGKTRGEILKGKIDEYKKFLVSLIDDKKKYKALVTSLEDNLSTKEINGSDGAKKEWLDANFDHMPLIGVVTLMSKIQADVRNSESDMLSYLFAQIDIGVIPFNKIEAVVKSPTNYVLMGQPYKAEVFIAASDTNANLVVKVGGNRLPVENGKGVYTGSTGAPGPKTWGGVIELKSPETGEIKKYPFQSEYQVGKASLVVSATKMNVLFIGVDNPVDISVQGVPQNQIHPTISGGGGTIRRSGNGYSVKVTKEGTVRIGASAELPGGRKNMGSMEFRVKRVPSPVAKIGDKKEGYISRSRLLAEGGVSAVLENFYFQLRYRVTGYTVSASVRGFDKEESTTRATFSGKQIALIKSLPARSKFYIEKIKVLGPDGRTRKIGSMGFRLQ